MKTINLTQGRYAMVDDQDYEWLSQFRWHAAECPNKGISSLWYAYRHAGQNRPKLSMHRAIANRCGFPSDKDCDHKDGNGLNNQRDNLRPCTNGQNNGNRRKESGCSSSFKGVYWRKERQQWISRLRRNKQSYFLGCFKSEIDAAKAYDSAAIIHFGEFALLNFPCR